MLELRIVQAVEELAKAVDLVAFGHGNEYREAHVELALDDVELLGDVAGFFLDFVGGIFDEAVGGDDKEKAVDGAVGAVLLEEHEELLPFAGFAGLDVLEHQAASGVEQHGVVGEPPIHVDSATDALEFVLHAGWEPYVAMANGFSLSRAGFADYDVPWPRVNAL